jgi:hypothetical protein
MALHMRRKAIDLNFLQAKSKCNHFSHSQLLRWILPDSKGRTGITSTQRQQAANEDMGVTGADLRIYRYR